MVANKQRLLRVNKLFKEMFGKNIDMTTFEDRIKLQKLIYSLKSAGAPFKYKFFWHIRGPYSPDLARDGFFISKNSDEFIEDTKFMTEPFREAA